MTDTDEERLFLIAPGRIRAALATLLKRMTDDVLCDLADHVEAACVASQCREQRLSVEFRARGQRVHGAFMSLPKRSGR